MNLGSSTYKSTYATHTYKNKHMHTHMKHGEIKKECLTCIKKILNIQQGFNMCKKKIFLFSCSKIGKGFAQAAAA